MKKILATIASLALVAGTASAQGGFSGLLQGLAQTALSQSTSQNQTKQAQQQSQASATAANAAAGILGSLLNTVASNVVKTDLKGSWNYGGVATAVGTDNALKDIAAQAAMGSVETKLNTNLEKIGIKVGAASFQFLEDGTFNLITEKMVYPGTWKQEGDAVEMKFGKILGLINLQGTVKATTQGVDVVFQANKFLVFVKNLMNKLGLKNTNSTIATLANLMDQIQELKAGFKLVRA